RVEVNVRSVLDFLSPVRLHVHVCSRPIFITAESPQARSYNSASIVQRDRSLHLGTWMLAYKFRSASEMQHAFDILINQRLHCSDWRKLNDPMEGQFGYSHNASD